MKLQLGYVVIFCLLLLKKWFGLPGLGGIVLNGLKWVISDRYPGYYEGGVGMFVY